MWAWFMRLSWWAKVLVVIGAIMVLNWIADDPTGAGTTIRREWLPPIKEGFWGFVDFFSEIAKWLGDEASKARREGQ